MRSGALAIGLILGIFLAAGGASAQATAVSPLLLADPTPVNFISQNSLFALPAAGAAAGAAAEPQGVQGVFATYTVEVYGGYTFLRLYEAPHIETNTNGFNVSAVYYPRQWVGFDGEGIGTFGSLSGTNEQFFMGVAGPRFAGRQRGESSCGRTPWPAERISAPRLRMEARERLRLRRAAELT